MIELTTVAFDASAGEATLDAIVLFTVLLLLACHGMARGWPAQLGGADGGGRAAALTRESLTIYGAVKSSWKAPCRAWTNPSLPAEATATSCSPRTSLPCVSMPCESVLLACSAACREPMVYW